MNKVAFLSDQLGVSDDEKRFKMWCDIYASHFGSLDFKRPECIPFRARCEFVQFGQVGVGIFAGTINRAGRTAYDLERDGKDDFFFVLNTGSTRLQAEQRGRTITIDPGQATLVSYSETGDFRGEDNNAWLGLVVAKDALRELVRSPDDQTVRHIDTSSDAFRHLTRYLSILVGPDDAICDPPLSEHVGKSLVELLALSLGAGRDVADIAGMSGLRAARTAEIIAAIRSGFANAACSPAQIAGKLRLSERYLQDLLAVTGATFSQRLMEARLQHALGMLESPTLDTLRIAEIARRSGFRSVPHFNRSFRRRFAVAPGDVRGRRHDRRDT